MQPAGSSKALIVLAACTLLFSGCQYLTGDYTVAGAEEKIDVDPDGDAGPADGGEYGDDDIVCTPVNASMSYSILGGPYTTCTKPPCNDWEPTCFDHGKQYVVVYTDGDSAIWFNNCYVVNPLRRDGEIHCRYNQSNSFSLFSGGYWSIDGDYDEAGDWYIYHRTVDEYEWLPERSGCGSAICEMYDGFSVVENRFYFVRRHTDIQSLWYEHCDTESLEEGRDKLSCYESSHRFVTFNSGEPDINHSLFTGKWTVFAEQLSDGQQHVYREPVPGCGDTSCELWDGFNIDPRYRYIVLEDTGTATRLYDICEAMSMEGDNRKLRCSSIDGGYIELNSDGYDTSGRIIRSESDWTLLRWSLTAQ